MQKGPVLQVKGVSKRFSGVTVLSDINFILQYGEVHAIVGENGAGKSTLIKILSGAYERDSGEILLRGVAFDELTPRLAQDAGIVTIYQERNLVPHLSVGENILIGNEPRGRWGLYPAHPTSRRDRCGSPGIVSSTTPSAKGLEPPENLAGALLGVARCGWFAAVTRW